MADNIQEAGELNTVTVEVVAPVEDIVELESPAIETIPVEAPIIVTSFEQMYEDLEAKLNEIGKVEHFYYVHKIKDECLELVAKIKKAAHIG